jgi:hypothetical protein
MADPLKLRTDASKVDMRSSAIFSSCRKYRYALTRTWVSRGRKVMFIGLNPSTADESSNDPTVRRCIGFAQRWGFQGMVLTNLFGYRSTDPSKLARLTDPVGAENDFWIEESRRTVDLVVVAWGARGSLHERDTAVLANLTNASCLGRTLSGAPKHPLYLPWEASLVPYCRADHRDVA